MRILALTNLYPTPFQPNRAPFNRQQLRALAARHELAVIAPIAWTDELRLRRSTAAEALPDSRRVTRDGIVVDHPRYIFPPKVLRRCYGYCFARSVRSAFARALDEFRPDVLLGSWAYPDGWAAVRLARDAGLPVVVKVHGSDVLLVRRNSRRLRLTVDALNAADRVVAVSRNLRETIVGLGVDSDKVSIVYGGVDTELFRPGSRDAARARLGIDRSTPLLLFVGNLLPVKGLDVLVDACALLHERGLGFDCRIIGEGTMRAPLERQIRRCGLGEQVRLPGARPLEQLPDWYRAADVFVLPSRSEGVPNVLLEATACGTPVVATRVGGVPEVAGLHPEALVPPNDPEALAGAIERRLSDSGACYGGCRPMSWDDSAASLSAALEGLN
jgi:glycosyltransferase involved in cell wall biosynthesis